MTGVEGFQLWTFFLKKRTLEFFCGVTNWRKTIDIGQW